jgi:hypothetical protein
LILILSDINMPGMTGLELLPKAKAVRPDVPVIMITAYGDDGTRRKALEGGAEALLTKPRFCCASRRDRQPRRRGRSRCPVRAVTSGLPSVRTFTAGRKHANNRHVNRRSHARRRDRCGVTRLWGLLPYYRRFTSVVSTCRRPHLSAGTSRCALPPFRLGRQKARQDLAGSPCRCRWQQVHAAINYSGAGMFSG